MGNDSAFAVWKKVEDECDAMRCDEMRCDNAARRSCRGAEVELPGGVDVGAWRVLRMRDGRYELGQSDKFRG